MPSTGTIPQVQASATEKFSTARTAHFHPEFWQLMAAKHMPSNSITWSRCQGTPLPHFDPLGKSGTNDFSSTAEKCRAHKHTLSVQSSIHPTREYSSLNKQVYFKSLPSAGRVHDGYSSLASEATGRGWVGRGWVGWGKGVWGLMPCW